MVMRMSMRVMLVRMRIADTVTDLGLAKAIVDQDISAHLEPPTCFETMKTLGH